MIWSMSSEKSESESGGANQWDAAQNYNDKQRQTR